VISGTLDLIQRSYAGTEIRGDVLHFQPRLRERLDGLTFPMRFRGTSIQVSLGDGQLTVVAETEGSSRPIRVGVGDEVVELCQGHRHTFALSPEPAASA